MFLGVIPLCKQLIPLISRTMSDTACNRCGDVFYKGHLTKCKALSRRCFKCQKIGHLSTQRLNSCIGTASERNGCQKEINS